LKKYPRVHEQLDVAAVLELISKWFQQLESGNFAVNPLTAENIPRLALLSARNSGWVFTTASANLHQQYPSVMKNYCDAWFEPETLQTPWVRERLGLNRIPS